MKNRRFGNTALETPVLGLGALHFGVFCDQEQTSRIVRAAHDGGVRFIDSAPMYGNGSSELLLGNAIAGIRDDLILSTKAGLTPIRRDDGTFGVEQARLTGEYLRESVEASLADLQTDRIDLFQLHAYDPITPLEETLGALESLVTEGKVRYVGCSNYNETELQSALAFCRDSSSRAALVALQCHYNLLESRAQKALLPMCSEHKLGVICNRTLARGILTGKYRPGEQPPEGSRAATSARIRSGLTDQTLDLVASLSSFAADHGKSVAQLAIAWLVQQADVTVALVGVRDLGQLNECIAGSKWKLEGRDLAAIEQIIAQHDMTEQVNTRPTTFLEK